MTSAVLTVLRETVARRLQIPESRITIEASFADDLGADSLAVMDLVDSLEGHFGISVPDEDVERIKTVGSLVAYVEDRLTPAAPEEG